MNYNKNSIIMRFKYNEKEYVVIQNNNKIEYGYLENNQIYLSLTEEENKLVSIIYNSLTINKETSVDCGIFKIKGKKIKIYYDLTSKLYFFYEYINNELKIPSKETLSFLNKYYNHQEEYVCIKEERLGQEKNTFIKRIFKIKDNFSSIVITSFLAFQLLPTDIEGVLTYGSDYYINPFKVAEKEFDEEQYSWNKIKQAIETNKNLTQEEKKFVLNIEKQIEENKEFINMKLIAKNLNNLDISYKEGFQKNPISKGIIGGKYFVLGNSIHMPLSKDLRSCDLSALNHEINHSLTEYYLDEFFINAWCIQDNALAEIVNELFTREYQEAFGIEGSRGYQTQMPFIYPLCEILDIETIKKFKYSHRTEYIIEDLMKIDPDIRKACQLITAINSIGLYEKKYDIVSNLDIKEKVENQTLEDLEEKVEDKTLEESIENDMTIYNLIKNYYEKKYNRDMTEDQIMMSYFDYLGIPEADEKMNSIYKGLKKTTFTHKGYISKEYKKKHNSVEMTYRQDNYLYKVNIDDKNRYAREMLITDQINLENLYDKETQNIKISSKMQCINIYNKKSSSQVQCIDIETLWDSPTKTKMR